jgi:fatty acid desaturase/peptidoglycan/LPS O-acetylase OafA/YrhL
MADKPSSWPGLVIGLHLGVVAGSGWLLAGRLSWPILAVAAVASGVSLFVLTGLVHEASHRLLARTAWLNELAGNLAGWLILTPLTAYRAFHLKHHQTTNREGDPNAPLNSRWMLGLGSVAYVALIHRHAWGLRGKALRRYLIETAGMAAFLAALVVLLPRAVRERAWLLPMAVVALLQNIRIVTEHLDLPAGRYRDTWQLVLPGWLSRWLLHNDHHLEHHLRPGLHWYELPGYRAELDARGPELGVRRVSLGRYFREVFLARPPAPERSTTLGTPGGRLRADAPEPAAGRPGASGPRLHGLDALRASTMFLVVVLHAALAYASVPIPDLIWVVRDPTAGPAFDILCWWALGISSPFFLMSGFFAAQTVEGRGTRALLADRTKRIVGPFVAAGLTILPATFFIWVFGWLVSGQCSPREILRMKFHAKGYQRNLYGPAHLWSLEYLAVMLAAYWVALELRRLVPGRTEALSAAVGWLGRRLASRWRPLLLALPTTLILWAGHRHVGLDALMDRLNSFTPEPFRLLHNAVFFAVGVILHRSRHDLGRFASHGWTYLALSVPVFAVRAWLIGRDLAQPLDGPASLALAASGALFAWLITFGFLGLALGSFARPNAAVRYLADSSYWIYLCHLPVVGLLQVDLFAVPAPAFVKFLVVLAVTMALGLSSYQALVRHTFLGLWLHGRRERSRPAVSSGPARQRVPAHFPHRLETPAGRAPAPEPPGPVPPNS